MTVLVQKVGDNVVDFVFKTFVSIITFLGYVGTNLVDNPLSIKLCPLSVTSLTCFPKESFLLDCPGLPSPYLILVEDDLDRQLYRLTDPCTVRNSLCA